jgi:hypothetical protein
MRPVLLLIFAVVLFVPVSAQTDADRDAIKRAALNYAEGYYEGNPEKMEAALHPDLAKRIASTTADNRSRLDQMSSLSLVQIARGGYGKNTPKDKQIKDVTILDVYRGAATVKLEMLGWIDYMHIAKFNGKWLIVNVLWETKPPEVKQN